MTGRHRGGPTALEVAYDDHVDGHVPQAIHEELRDGSTVVWTVDGDLHQADLCNGVVNGRTASAPTTTPTALSTTTTVPSGTLPETGSSNLTWSIGAVAGLLTTAGAALFAGVRRSRND